MGGGGVSVVGFVGEKSLSIVSKLLLLLSINRLLLCHLVHTRLVIFPLSTSLSLQVLVLMYNLKLKNVNCLNLPCLRAEQYTHRIRDVMQ